MLFCDSELYVSAEQFLNWNVEVQVRLYQFLNWSVFPPELKSQHFIFLRNESMHVLGPPPQLALLHSRFGLYLGPKWLGYLFDRNGSSINHGAQLNRWQPHQTRIQEPHPPSPYIQHRRAGEIKNGCHWACAKMTVGHVQRCKVRAWLWRKDDSSTKIDKWNIPSFSTNIGY